MFVIALSIGFFTSSTLLYYSVKRNIEYMEKLDELEESLRTSIEILEEQYQLMDQKTKIEVFSDEPVIRELVKDISVARNSVLHVAKLLDDSIDVENE